MSEWRGIVGKPFTIEEFDRYVGTIDFSNWRGRFVVLHNTAIPTFAQWHKVSGERRMRALEGYYRDQQKWKAGPHLFVADDAIWVFTPLNRPGTHAPSWNAIAWGVEMVGDYATEPLRNDVLANTVGAIAALTRVGGFDPATMKLHKEDPKTTHKGCPGKNVQKALVIEAVRDRLSGAPVARRRPVLRRGSTDSVAVAELQALLGMKVNAPGTFGPLTEERLKEFQRANGLDDDGVAGRDSWRVLEQRAGQ